LADLENCFAVTVPQPEAALAVISQRAEELRPSKLHILNDADIESLVGKKSLGLAGKHQTLNAALASNLVQEWIRLKRDSGNLILPIDKNLSDEDAVSIGLERASWPGRCQQLQSSHLPGSLWYLDGAHTKESLEVKLLSFRN
jgi:folylpolyglutamate synthase